MALPLASMGSAFGGNYVLIGSVVNKTYFLYDVSGMHRVLTPPYGLLFTPTPFCTPLYDIILFKVVYLPSPQSPSRGVDTSTNLNGFNITLFFTIFVKDKIITKKI